VKTRQRSSPVAALCLVVWKLDVLERPSTAFGYRSFDHGLQPVARNHEPVPELA
jgi:hypothetical protein